MFETCQHAQPAGLLPPGRRNFSLKSARIPAKNCLPAAQNPSLPDTSPIFKQALMVQYIQKHFSEMISLEDLAASANISRSEAGRCFQKYYADTPMSYLIRYRLQQAQKLLLTSTLSVKEISCQCGFSDSSYFVKVFRKHMKRTPAEYRRVYQMTHQI